MLILSEKEIMENYSMKDGIADLKKGLGAKRDGYVRSPERTVMNYPAVNGSGLYMPSADLEQEIASVKVVSIFPENPKEGKPTTQGVLVLSDAHTGEHVCVMNASYLTRLRTGALSAVATESFSRTDARVLGVIGTGAMAFEQVLGVLEARDIHTIILFNRTVNKAQQFRDKLIEFGVTCTIDVVDHVDSVLESSDIINCATRSNKPVFDGTLLKQGTHINGVGSFLPTMREVDLQTIQKANKIIVDDLHGVKEEAGELIHAAEESNWSFSDVYAELYEVDGDTLKRENEKEITFFKSVGSAYFDHAVATGVYRKAKELNLGQHASI
ncbi:ornithine cyclodeaminase family protein [Lentibacillus cibarius]|uniref:Ornithine cyclodeaminase family protein n=1 Tax=Lentibacillus cibarius TaxID=2583219 RepID=A0A549YGI2_9BACI|nr:ornithine cyclodeaminase family protein [Lentibacillus cibarius]TRM11011.1 ornithine cyclodeaminase family protein [Lentibacillus cibarius]